MGPLRMSTAKSRIVLRSSLLVAAVWIGVSTIALKAPQAVHAAPHASPHAAPATQIGGWTSISPEGTWCGRGSPFMFYFNPAPDPEAGLLIYLNGGGVCVKDGPAPEGASGVAEQLHCMNFSNFEDSALNATTIGFMGLIVPFFNRGLADNPFKDYNLVAVPYCTGDVHAGAMIEPYDYNPDPDEVFVVTQRGHLNFLAVLDEVQKRLPGNEREVVLTGASAGGFGAIYNFPSVIARWPKTTLLPDAGIGPGHQDSLLVRDGSEIAERWGSRIVLPEYCPTDDCMTDTLGLLAAHARHHDGVTAPWRPFAYLQGQQDGTLSDFLEIDPCGYQLGLRAGVREAEAVPNLRGWIPATAEHVFSTRAAFTTADGTGWLDFFGQAAAATSPEEMPPTVIDPWLRCNDVMLPVLTVRR